MLLLMTRCWKLSERTACQRLKGGRELKTSSVHSPSEPMHPFEHDIASKRSALHVLYSSNPVKLTR